MSPIHRPVMVEEAVTLLAPERGGLFADCTVGLGGHAEALLRRGERARLLGLDRDPQALALAAERLRPFGERVRLVRARFSELEAALGEEALEGGVLADLGVSSLQLDSAERGFSLQQEGPLDMRMSGGNEKGIDTGGGEESTSAFDLVNEAPEEQLQQIFSEFGEERMARRIAQTIAAARVQRPVRTTRELRELVYRAKGGRRKEGRIDSATRVFQALRIAVNEELQQLERLLGEAVRLMRPDGRLVVISYHSLEDRMVKHRLKAWADPLRDPTTGRQREEDRIVELLTRKAMRPSEAEIAINPRARSARLRAARKLV
ncbi:MAG TPA: 16S rRNA (cytosine(1402)-N(4))-methyltransferase RsmH [Thermoanaerobaculia bacterium]|jgi:16S rRNA (cytosine1402-N4)-methyltransferase|nr:16S rRNA (cytosine(1402)-N(4))-methyltransferase RsmH [Thermoanaerobaculia bacterium]